ncbi:hypothetical protein M413DRAFT_285546 [Hebeloma cylindrosporum]|uniref:Uncharacterized protein n=1 Tax=Hebeloma cylindrosporum TaxID=76867 RepID=A0A0C2XFB8_HEBCY|nr:hypothetical protein M413DRAFT_285546 [Hebeloma cylindrosporum h7]
MVLQGAGQSRIPDKITIPSSPMVPSIAFGMLAAIIDATRERKVRLFESRRRATIDESFVGLPLVCARTVGECNCVTVFGEMIFGCRRHWR